MKPVEAAGALLAEVEEPPAAEALKPPTPARETTPAPSVTTQTPPKTSARKSHADSGKSPGCRPKRRNERARTEPVTKAAPSHLEAVTVVSEKIVAPASPASPPKMTGPPAPVIPKSSAVQNVVPWVGRNVRPIGIGIAALLAVSLAYGLIQKMRSRNVTDNNHRGEFSHAPGGRTSVETR